MLPTIVIMTKQPRPGHTKTRLCPPLTPEQAASVAEALLRETLALTRRVPRVQPALATSPDTPEAKAFFTAVAPDLPQIAQGEGGLGNRLACVSGAAFALGAPMVAVLSTDSPSLPEAYLHQAFALLSDYDVTIGPTEDGGYYLAALRQPAPSLFTRPTMSSPTTCAETIAVAQELGLRVALLPTWYDLDTVADLRRVRADPAALPYLRPVLHDCGL